MAQYVIEPARKIAKHKLQGRKAPLDLGLFGDHTVVRLTGHLGQTAFQICKSMANVLNPAARRRAESVELVVQVVEVAADITETAKRRFGHTLGTCQFERGCKRSLNTF